jgi:large subunit ribosomal protein L4
MAAAITNPKLDKAIFDVEVKNHELLKLAYESYLAEGRQVGAKTLRRGEVRGGGKKPWRQKGTGRARFGSSRNPIWRGGGVAFGPLGNENYTKKVPKNSKRVALRQALTLAAQAKKIMVIDSTSVKLTGKTRDAYKILQDLGVADKRRILGVVADKKPYETVMRSTANLANLEIVRSTYLTVWHILNADVIVFTSEALDLTTKWLKGEKLPEYIATPKGAK